MKRIILKFWLCQMKHILYCWGKSINRNCVKGLPKIHDNIMNEHLRFGEERHVLGLLAHTHYRLSDSFVPTVSGTLVSGLVMFMVSAIAGTDLL